MPIFVHGSKPPLRSNVGIWQGIYCFKSQGWIERLPSMFPKTFWGLYSSRKGLCRCNFYFFFSFSVFTSLFFALPYHYINGDVWAMDMFPHEIHFLNVGDAYLIISRLRYIENWFVYFSLRSLPSLKQSKCLISVWFCQVSPFPSWNPWESGIGAQPSPQNFSPRNRGLYFFRDHKRGGKE